MKFIRIEYKPPCHAVIAREAISYVGTLDALREYIKGLARDSNGHVWNHEVFDFYEIELETDKEAITGFLNGDIPEGTELRSFYISNRGGLKENEVSK